MLNRDQSEYHTYQVGTTGVDHLQQHPDQQKHSAKLQTVGLQLVNARQYEHISFQYGIFAIVVKPQL